MNPDTTDQSSGGRLLSQNDPNDSHSLSGALAINPDFGVGDDKGVFVWDGGMWKKVVAFANDWSTEWHLITTVYKSSGDAVGYKDGQLDNTASATFDGSGFGMGLALPFNDHHGSFFDGELDDVRIYNRVLSDKEIESLAAMGGNSGNGQGGGPP